MFDGLLLHLSNCHPHCKTWTKVQWNHQDSVKISLFITYFDLFPLSFALLLPGSGLVEYVPIRLLRLGRFSQISSGSVFTEPLCQSHSESQRVRQMLCCRGNMARENSVRSTWTPF